MNVYTTIESPVGELLLVGRPSPDGVTLTSVTMAGQRYAPAVRDGVSTVRSGHRHALGLVFHDA